MPLLVGRPAAARRLFWHFPCYVGRATPSSAVRDGNLKLVEFFEDGGHVELYDLAADPNEQHDLAQERPADALALAKVLHDWQRETAAALPAGPNPAYDPKAERPRGRQGEQRGGQGGRGRRSARGEALEASPDVTSRRPVPAGGGRASPPSPR